MMKGVINDIQRKECKYDKCLEKDAVALGVADQVWFEIPQLSDGRKVRYYVHNDMGYGIEHWETFVNVVRALEKGRSCCLLPADLERQLKAGVR